MLALRPIFCFSLTRQFVRSVSRLSRAMKTAKTVKFNNGLECPLLGLGTYQAEGDECVTSVKHAIDVGYRHVDTALYYRNETAVGRAVNEKIQEGVVSRDEIFITSKLWNTFHRAELVEPALRQTLKNLCMDYVDLYLIHWPVAFKDGWELSPRDENGVMQTSDADFIETWSAMEECVCKGLVKSIGLSNFTKDQTLRILDTCRIKPVNNQVESHPYLAQTKLVEFCKSKDITVTAYRPVGGPPQDPNSPIHDGLIKCLADKYNKTPGQILIKFQAQRDVIVIPKSVSKERICSNFDVFDFELSPEDMQAILKLDKGNSGRSILLKDGVNHKEYPFNVEF